MAAWLLTVEVPAASAELIGDRLWAAGAIAIEERELDSTEVTLIAGFATEADGEAARSQLDSHDGRLAPAPPAEEWHDVWLDHLEPTRIGSFVVHPPWLDVSAAEGRPITIDPGRAFGSGQHPSTALAIAGLEACVQPQDHVLDVGTGSGILAIAAAHLGASRVLGIDIDPEAVAQTHANVETNRVADRVTATDEPLAEVDATFEIVVANITCHSMLPLVGDLVHRTTRDLVVSGLLVSQRELLIEGVLANMDSELTQERGQDEWCSLTFTLFG